MAVHVYQSADERAGGGGYDMGGMLIAAFGCFAVILVAWALAPAPVADPTPPATERS
jgi:hypothetical protein